MFWKKFTAPFIVVVENTLTMEAVESRLHDVTVVFKVTAARNSDLT